MKNKLPVSSRALMQRINRKLKESDEVLRTARGDRWRHETGDYYIIDIRRNTFTEKDVNLEEKGRDLGVLKPYEALVED